MTLPTLPLPGNRRYTLGTATLLATGLALVVACADQQGSFTAPPSLAKATATAGFNSNDFYQCSTGNPRRADPPTSTGCSWISGNLNSTHNVYFEGDVIPQKLIIDDVTAGNDVWNTLVLQYGFKKSGHGTYDFLGAYFAGTGPNNPCTDTQTKMAEFCTGTTLKSGATLAFPAPVQGDLSASDFAAVQAAYNRFVNDQSRSPNLTIVGASEIEIDPATYEVSSSATLAHVTIRFRKATGFQRALVLWGAHFADSRDWGAGLGAAGLSGSPFHTKLVSYQSGNKTPTVPGAMAINVSGNVVVAQPKARISINPPTATNGIGEAHTFTVKVEKDLDDGGGWQPAAGEHVDFTLTNAGGANHVLNAAASTCDDAGANTDLNGECVIVFTSNSTGTVTGHASATLFDMLIETGGVGGFTGDAVKTFVSGNIKWLKHDGAGALLGGAVFTVCRTHDWVSSLSSYVDIADVCEDVTDDAVPDADPTPGKFELQNVTLGKYTIVEKTPPTGYNADGSTKNADLSTTTTSVDLSSTPFVNIAPAAKISIAATATNGIGEAHTFTVTVEKDPEGDGTFVAAAGVDVDFTLTDGGGASSVLNAASSTCDDAGANTDASGQCTIVFSSATAGTVTGSASASVLIGSVTVNVQTDGTGGSSSTAVKTFVDGNIKWLKHDGAGALLGGAVFTVCRTENWVSSPAPGSFVDIVDACFDVTDNSAPDADAANGKFELQNLTLGKYTITEKTPPAGYNADGSTKNANLNTTTTSVDLSSTPFVNTAPAAKISIAATATNGIGEAHTFTVTVEKDPEGDGTFVAAAGEDVDFTLVNAGGASFVLDATASTCDDAGANTNASGQCTIVFSSATAGTVTGNASASLTIGSVTVNVQTNGANGSSNAAVKTYIAGTLTWEKRALSTTGALLGGATFEVCRTDDYVSATATYTTLGTPVCVTVVDNTAPDVDAADGKFKLVNLILGKYTIEETVAPPGYVKQEGVQGPFIVITSTAVNGGIFVNDEPIIPEGDICVDGNKPRSINVLYNGNGTLNDSHNQTDVTINVVVAPADRPTSGLTIITYDHRDIALDTYTNMTINSTFLFKNTGNKLVPPNATFRVFSGPPNARVLLEEVSFHTSCSQPLAAGDEFGSFRVLEGLY